MTWLTGPNQGVQPALLGQDVVAEERASPVSVACAELTTLILVPAFRPAFRYAEELVEHHQVRALHVNPPPIMRR